MSDERKPVCRPCEVEMEPKEKVPSEYAAPWQCPQCKAWLGFVACKTCGEAVVFRVDGGYCSPKCKYV
tara:strand:- start:353 stop:556 length:204 start_codon:yes stop_codon:yes gene_type:complete